MWRQSEFGGQEGDVFPERGNVFLERESKADDSQVEYQGTAAGGSVVGTKGPDKKRGKEQQLKKSHCRQSFQREQEIKKRR